MAEAWTKTANNCAAGLPGSGPSERMVDGAGGGRHRAPAASGSTASPAAGAWEEIGGGLTGHGRHRRLPPAA